jgi:hypothetical protein
VLHGTAGTGPRTASGDTTDVIGIGRQVTAQAATAKGSTENVRHPRKRHTVIRLAVAMFSLILTSGAWAMSSPPGSSPDSDFHLASIWCAAGPAHAGVNSCVRRNGEYLVRGDVARIACFARKPTVSGECINGADRTAHTARVNEGTYPGLFYRSMHLLVMPSLAKSVLLMRLVNLLICAGLVGAALALARPGLRRAVALTWMVTFIPLAAFLVPSTNPSSWTISGLGTLWAFLYSFLQEPPGARRRLAAVFCVLSTAITVGSRSDGAAFVILVIAALMIVAAKPRTLSAFQIALTVVLACIAGLVFLRSGQSHSIEGLGAPIGDAGRQGSQLLLSNVYSFPGLLLGVFGLGWGLGWFDTFLHPSIGALVWGAVSASVVLSTAEYWRRKSFGVAFLGGALFVVPLVVLQGGGDYVGEDVQPRYLLPLVLCVVGLSLVSNEENHRNWSCSRGGLAIMAVAVSLANMLALQTELRRYVTGLDVPSIDLNFAIEWWWPIPLDPMSLWFYGTVSGVALFFSLASIAHSAIPPSRIRGTGKVSHAWE